MYAPEIARSFHGEDLVGHAFRSEFADGDGGLDAVRDALDADLDAPAAVRVVDEAVAAGKGVSRTAALLGVDV